MWAEQDANLHVVALINASGAVVERFDYTAFGVQTATGSVSNWSYTWQGMRVDGVNGWVESESRWYSPALGVWTSVDPLGFGGGDVREYGFEGNQPNDSVDADGEADSKWVIISDAKGPDFAKDRNSNVDPKVVYWQVRGLAGFVTGQFTQPASATNGSRAGPLPGNKARYGSGQSVLEVEGNGQDGGVCNTPLNDNEDKKLSDVEKSWLSHGASIKVSLVGFKPGKYRVTVDWLVEQIRSGEGNIGSIVNVVAADENGKLTNGTIKTLRGKPTDLPTTKGTAMSQSEDGQKTVEVTVVPDGKADVFGLKVVIAGRSAVAKADLALATADISEVK